VEILSQEAGMTMPARDPKAQEKADRRTQLVQVMELALRHYRMCLQTGAGAGARAYLAQRGLSEETQTRFEIGFAPDGWQGLWDHLTGKGVPEELILAAGLAKPSSKGGKPYDVFRNRIMFPIRDPRGRLIAFGGRAMDPGESAKYLNSPETELFDKGRSLYNHGPAREAAGKGAPLIVAEGYMDVIALAAAGFGAAVAPLGTAVTEHQLAHLWRITEEPIIALDGDAAGLRAAYRVIDLALPLLAAGKSLRFALMPQGMDPDDLLQSKGPEGLKAVLDGALPMVHLLWQRETEGRVFDSPERKAALDKALREKLRLIQDDSLRRHYGDALKELRWQMFRPPRRGPSGAQGRFATYAGSGGRGLWGGPRPPLAETKGSALVAAGEEVETELREAVLLSVLLLAPELIQEVEPELERLEPSDLVHRRLRDTLLRFYPAGAETLRSEVVAAIGAPALDALLARPHVSINPCVRHPGDLDKARQVVGEELAKLQTWRGRAAEIAEAEEDIIGFADEAVTWRLAHAAEAHQAALQGSDTDRTEYDTGPNGAKISRDERDAFAAILDRIAYKKSGRLPPD